jgi:predicted amidohydrolase YtcJ
VALRHPGLPPGTLVIEHAFLADAQARARAVRLGVGILAPGAFGDVVGFRGDLLDCAVDDLPSQQPALTLVGGRAVHDPDGLLGSPVSA